MVSILGLGRSPGGGNGNPLQYPCLENPMDRGAWRATVRAVTKLDMTESLTMLGYINAYKRNLEKLHWWTYLQEKNRDADTENGLVDTVGEGEGGTSWENSIGIYILPRVKQTAGGKLLYNTGSWAWCSVITQVGGMGEAGGLRERHMCVHTHTHTHTTD